MKIKLFTIPNIITLMNLLCGSIAATAALQYGNLIISFAFIMLAAILDFFDGFAARALGQYSTIGKELDSLADVISFGFAPSAILFAIYQQTGGVSPWGYGVFIVAAFSALRLAKFNIDDRQSDEFIGLPTPAAAMFVASLGYMFTKGEIAFEPYAVLVAAAFISLFLVCELRMFSLKFHNFKLQDNSLRYIFLLLSLVVIGIFKIPAIPVVIISYILISAGRSLVQKLKK